MATLLPDENVSRDDAKGHRIFIYSHDHPHPPHVHVGKGTRVSEWRLETMTCIDADGFSAPEIKGQRKILLEHRESIWERWHVHWQNQ